MKKTEMSFIEAFLALFCIGIVVSWIWEEEKENNRRIQGLKNRLNNGSYLDAAALDSDWISVGQDVRQSYQTLSQNMNINAKAQD